MRTARTGRRALFVLVDSLTNDTVAAGMILEARAGAKALGEGELARTHVSPAERRERLGHAGAVIALDSRCRARSSSRSMRSALSSTAAAYAIVAPDGGALGLVEAGLLVVCSVGDSGAEALEERLGESRVVRVRGESGEANAVRLVSRGARAEGGSSAAVEAL